MTLATLPSPNFTGADLSARVNAALLEVRAARRFATVAALLADATMAYGTGSRPVAAGDVVEAGGFRYEVAASAATDHHLSTAGGLKLKVLPAPDGTYNFAAMAPAADGVTNDYPKLRLLLDIVTFTRNGWTAGPAVFFPNGRYYMGQTIELKDITRLMGSHSGMPGEAGAELVFPANTTGIIVHRANTIGDGVEPAPTTGAGDASIIEGLMLVSAGGTDTTKHGVRLRARAVVRNCLIRAFPGDGVHIRAGAGAGGSQEGNANNWLLDTLRIQNCGGNGVYVNGADANSGTGIALDASANRLWGIWDNSFLGNTWIGCHVDANGYDGSNQRSAYCWFADVHYHAVPGATEAQLRTTQPGTNAAIWRACSGTVGPLAWTGSNPEGTFRQGGGYHSDGLNARCTFEGCYSEGGQGLTWLSQHSIAIGGFLLECPVASGAFIEGRFNDLWTSNGFVSEGTSSAGVKVAAELGGSPSTGDVLRFQRNTDGEWRLRYVGPELYLDHANLGTRLAMYVTGTGTAVQMGTGAPVPYVAGFPVLAVGTGSTIRHQTTGTAVPTTGAWAQGDIVWNTSPTAGGFAGWICTTAGTPGTWKTFGAISA